MNKVKGFVSIPFKREGAFKASYPMKKKAIIMILSFNSLQAGRGIQS